jgi:phosphohistidine phosphatase
MADFERPLSDRGRNETPMMAREIARRAIRPELIISSPAVRALSTARLVAEAMAVPHHAVRVEPSLYEASIDHYLDVIKTLPDEVQSVLLVGHNPTLTELVNVLAPAAIGDIPACGVVAVGTTADSWGNVRKNCGKLLFFEHPPPVDS